MECKGYQLYDLGKVFHSRDVIFNKQKYGFKEPSQAQKEPQPTVYLESSDELLTHLYLQCNGPNVRGG